jgi:hypothetical protein
MLDPAFAAAAVSAFDNDLPAHGPYTLALGNSAIYVSLPHLTPNHTLITSAITSILTSNTAASYLPPDIRSSQAMIAGYESQLRALATLLANPHSPSLETPWSGGSSAVAFLLHPLSRGTVRLNTTHPLEQPILDYRACSNPIDLDIHVAHTRFLRKIITTPTSARYGAVEILPGADVESSDEAKMQEFVKDQIVLSFMHPCCTAAMLPRNKGGVVGADLKVHGAKGLRVVDMSVLPLVPGSHLSATAYAVGEKVSFFFSSFLFWVKMGWLTD